MLNRDIVVFFMEHVPDEIRVLRDSIAKDEADGAGPIWERHRELSGHIKELRDGCEQAGHTLTIALAGRVGTRRHLMRNSRPERRACIMCGTEEVGVLASGFFSRFMLRRAKWEFVKLNGYTSRAFTNPEWYFETLSIIRNPSFSTDVILHHAFTPQIPHSLLDGEDEAKSSNG